MTRTSPRHVLRSFVYATVLALVLVALPVRPVIATERAPETRETLLEELEPETGERDGEWAESGDAVELPPAEGPKDDLPEQTASPTDATVATETEQERSRVVESPFPFSGLGIKGTDEVNAVWYRFLDLDGEWSTWEHVDIVGEEDGPDPGSTEDAAALQQDGWVSEPIWVGEATHLQIEVDGGEVSDLDVHVIDTMGLSETLLERVRRAVTSRGTAAEAAERPNIITRSQWGANEALRKGSPSYATPKMAVLHHTATTNTYTREQAAGQIRNIYQWHTTGNGWNDIGYNLVVDRFGNIYEGRFGGVHRGVIGAHASGWNTGTFGVAILGNHEIAVPTSSTLESVASVLAWKYRLHGIDPTPSATVVHNGRRVSTLVGHRDVGSTACPGQYVVSRMGNIRQRAYTLFIEGLASATPITGDWDGNGVTNLGWFYPGGLWRLQMTNGTIRTFWYGRDPGDVPVTGNWNGDKFDGVGVFRKGGEWHLRNSLESKNGMTAYSFTYGLQPGDIPVTGDWTGNGRDGVGVFRKGGEWHLRNSLSTSRGLTVRSFTYGTSSGDLPVTGNWTGQGADGVGVFRKGGEWHLRNSLADQRGMTVHSLKYGKQAWDVPVTGDWNKDDRTTPGVVRVDTWFFNNSFTSSSSDGQRIFSR